MTWTDERVEELRTLYAEGLSGSEIAEAMGCPGQRNSIIGKIYRLKLTRDFHLSKRGGSHPKHRKPPKPRPERRDRFRWLPPKPADDQPAALIAAPRPAPVADEDIPVEQRRTLMELENEHCRYPIGDPTSPDFFFCSHPTADMIGSRPYCRFHANICSAGLGRAPERVAMWGRARA